MKLLILGLTISSSWGNGHATLWRGLCGALIRRGHEVVFYERDVPYYAENRDFNELAGGRLVLYRDWAELRPRLLRDLADADVALITSYCPDALSAGELVCESRVPVRAFYDLDTPVTLADLRAGRQIAYLGPRGLRDFHLVLSYTGGAALDELRRELGAARVAPLYGSADPALHRPSRSRPALQAALSYLGTFAADRQPILERLFLEPARRRGDATFVIGGACYPASFPWTANTHFVRHLPPPEHAAFFAASRLTLNVTRPAMAAMGYCPSGRLFEAAACGCPMVSDVWEGIDFFYRPGSEIKLAQSTDDVLALFDLTEAELRRIGEAARERTLAEHTADVRAGQLERILDELDAPATPLAAARGRDHVLGSGA